jgi:hypothetical protein
MQNCTRLLLLCVLAGGLAACVTSEQPSYALTGIPAESTYCQAAQRVVARTNIPTTLVVHDDFDSFVKAKTNIEGPLIHQYNWRNEEGLVTGISCKMKSSDHLNLEFGDGSAGPEAYCHDMNQQLYESILKSSDAATPMVVFDPSERLNTKEQATMIGPLWLEPFTLTSVDAEGALHVATKGFTIRFDDPRYQKFPPTWRGTHYCHFIAPGYFQLLLQGAAKPGAVIGRAKVRGYYPK